MEADPGIEENGLISLTTNIVDVVEDRKTTSSLS